jgi:hypothetical protein
MPARQCHELSPLAEKEWTTADKQPAGTRLHDRCNGGMEFSLVCSFHDQDLPTNGTTRLLQGEDGDAPKVHTVRVPAPRPRARKEIIVPGGRERTPRRINHALVLAIARAKTWMQDLRNGNYADTIDIAQRFKLNDAHVRRVLRFGYLAPDIVEAIAEGRQPRSLTVKRLLQRIPCAWPDQRAAFGFTN